MKSYTQPPVRWCWKRVRKLRFQWQMQLKKRALMKLKYVRFWLASQCPEFASSATERIWLQHAPFRWVKRSESLQHSPLVSLVHSWHFVRSTWVVRHPRSLTTMRCRWSLTESLKSMIYVKFLESTRMVKRKGLSFLVHQNSRWLIKRLVWHWAQPSCLMARYWTNSRVTRSRKEIRFALGINTTMLSSVKRKDWSNSRWSKKAWPIVKSLMSKLDSAKS